MATPTARPHLLVVTTTYPRWARDAEPGFVHELCRRLLVDFDVTVVCPHAPGAHRHEQLDGVRVVRCRYAPQRWQTLAGDGGLLANLRRRPLTWFFLPPLFVALAAGLLREHARRPADVVHAHWLVPQGAMVAALQAMKLLRVPMLATAHGADVFALRGRVFAALRRAVLRRAGQVTVVSHAMRDRLAAEGADVGAVRVQPMGVDLRARFVPDATPRAPARLLFVGRLVEKKGVCHLIDAMPAIVARVPDCRLDIVGFGPEREALEQRVKALGLQERIDFLGAVPQLELPALYRRAALFVAPFVEARSGDQEGLGLVLVEAIGCGCPVLAGDVPAVRDVLAGIEDALFAPGDHRALADAAVRLLEDPARRARQADATRGRVLERLDWQNVAAGYAAQLHRLVDARRR